MGNFVVNYIGKDLLGFSLVKPGYLVLQLQVTAGCNSYKLSTIKLSM